MASPVYLRKDGNVAVITLDNPPINALAHAVRVGLLDVIESADGDRDVAAIVIHAAGRMFVGGADIKEFDAGPPAPLLNDVLLRIEMCSKPVIAAVHGSALGGGFELALASHYRIASAGASFGLPEVKLGLLPGAGGTQRLPRLIGPQLALELMLTGEILTAQKALDLGILDRISDSPDVSLAALEWARELVEARARPRRTRDRNVDATGVDRAFFDTQREQAARRHRGVESAPSIVRCVEAAVAQPFEAALGFSRQLFEQARTSVSSRALRHLFFAERGTRVAHAPRAVTNVAVLGAGTMGAGIAISLATAGYAVTLIDTKPEAVSAGLKRVRDTINASVAKGRLTESAASEAVTRVATSTDFEAASSADLVIEAVFESISVKREVFEQLDKLCKPGAVLASNTSTLSIDRIASATARPADVVGMHFFSPANIMRLVEIVRGAQSSETAIATALAVAKRVGKLGIVVGNCFGFVGNRMLYGYGRENQLMLLEGAGALRIDSVLMRFGMAMGPNAVGDLAGLDVGYRVRRERTDLPPDPRYYRVADLLVEAGLLGQKTGRGTFCYAAGSREPMENQEVEAMIAAEARRLGVTRREFTDGEIVERCILALVNEGARILGEGIAATAADIDAIWCNGYGFPRFRGGPMFYADTQGLAQVLTSVRRLAAEHGELYWSPAPLLVELAERGDTFAKWSGERELQAASEHR